MPQFLAFLTLIVWSSIFCIAQTDPVKSGTIANPSNTPAALYKSATNLSPHLYNGNRYHIYDSRSLDHQFFQTEEWSKGVIEYDGQQFDSIPMLYDIFKDQVVIQYQGHPGLIQLQSERVRTFSYINHQFVRVEADKAKDITIPTGFYDVLYDGKTQLLARRTKLRQEQIEGNKVKVSFSSKNFFYIKKDNQYYIANTKGAVWGVFEDQKKALKKYLREQRLNYRKNTEKTLIKLSTHYDQLAHP